MNIKIALLSAACALALSACGGENAEPPAQTTTPPAATTEAAPAAAAPAQPAPATTPAAGETAAAGDTAPAAGGDAAVGECAAVVESNDAMQYNVKAISVPASCTDFTITLKHVGKMPVAAMGHNVVITTQADMQGVIADGMAAGLDSDYVKPDDARVIAHTKMIGGGESTEISFPVSTIKEGGPFKFFCSFPGHAALMNGSISVE